MCVRILFVSHRFALTPILTTSLFVQCIPLDFIRYSIGLCRFLYAPSLSPSRAHLFIVLNVFFVSNVEHFIINVVAESCPYLFFSFCSAHCACATHFLSVLYVCFMCIFYFSSRLFIWCSGGVYLSSFHARNHK